MSQFLHDNYVLVDYGIRKCQPGFITRKFERGGALCTRDVTRLPESSQSFVPEEKGLYLQQRNLYSTKKQETTSIPGFPYDSSFRRNMPSTDNYEKVEIRYDGTGLNPRLGRSVS